MYGTSRSVVKHHVITTVQAETENLGADLHSGDANDIYKLLTQNPQIFCHHGINCIPQNELSEHSEVKIQLGVFWAAGLGRGRWGCRGGGLAPLPTLFL